MPNKPTTQAQLLAENADLRARLEKAEESLREILSGEADALFVSGVGGAQLFTLKGADQSYRLLIENMSEGALTLTAEGVILYANRRFAEMLRTPLEKLIGSGIHNWFASESRHVLQTLLQKDALDNHREELALAAADGTQVPVYISVNRLVLGEIGSVCMVATDLTEQKRNEAILAAEKLSNAILEQAADAIVICDETGRIMRASKQAQALYDHNPIGQLFEHAFPLRQLDGTAFSAVVATDTNRSLSVEARLERNGQEFDLLVSVGHLKGARNELLGSVVTLTDISERIRAEEAMLRKQTELRVLLDLLPTMIWFKDTENRIMRVNKHVAQAVGMSVEEIEGKPSVEIYPQDAAKYYVDDLEVIRSGKPKLAIVETVRGSDNKVLWVQTDKVPFCDKDGKVRGICVMAQDITGRKLIEMELRESERRFTDMLGNVELVSVMRDREERITYCNEYLLHLTGWRYNEVIGKNWVELFVPPEIAEQKKIVFAELLLDRPEARHHESEILTRSGKHRLIHWNNSLLRSTDGDVIGTASIGEDITDRKVAEASIKSLNRVLSVLSGINTLIVRVRDRDELFREACRIAVEKGGFNMALIAVVDSNTIKVVSIASAGKNEELMISIRSILSSSEDSPKTIVARAIREKKALVSNDMLSDPRVLFGKIYAEAGVKSLVVLPLIVSDEAAGALTLYASEIEFFHEEEMQLLTELAGDISFAIDHIGKQEKLNYLAYYDVLTGLANRTLFLERAAQYIHSAISGGHQLAIGLIDLDRFKNINDSLGRPAGDELLKLVAEWMTQFARDTNLLARIDADHFAIVVPEVKSDGNLAKLVENLLVAFLEHSFHLNDTVLRLGIKVGIALFPDDGTDADTLFRNAEAALKKAKKSGDRYLFHTQKMTEAVVSKLILENQLRQAIDNKEFVLHYQPKVNLVSGKVTGTEALIRWNDPRTGLVPPGMFIPILEETGMIYEVGRWALHQAIRDYLRWRAAGLPVVRIAVNVSPLQLRNINFIDEIRQVIALDAHAAAGLELEITESLIMEDVELSIASLHVIRTLGVTIAIDDFGTGFSSLSYLSKLPVDTLKIDRAFVVKMDNPEGMALVSTIILLAHALKLKVVAEGVETEQQSRQLLSLNCDEMQGFLFSKPVSAEIFEARFLVPLAPGGKQ